MNRLFFIGIILIVGNFFGTCQTIEQGDTALLETWGEYRYENLLLIDSTLQQKGRFQSINYSSIEGLYQQYVTPLYVMTVNHQTKQVVVFYHRHQEITKKKSKPMKIKRKNMLPDSLIRQINEDILKDSLSEYSTRKEGGYIYTSYSKSKVQYAFKTDEKTDQIVEQVVSKTEQNETGEFIRYRKEYRLLESTTSTKEIQTIITTDNVFDSNTKQLTKTYQQNGYYLLLL